MTSSLDTGQRAGPQTAGATCLHVLLINSLMMGGGVDSHTLSLGAALLAQGQQVSLALPSGSRWVARAQAVTGLRLLLLDGHRMGWPFALARLMRREAVQVVHAHHGRDYWVAIVSAWLARFGAGARAARPVAVVTRHLMTPLKDKTRRLLGGRTRLIAVSDAVLGVLQRGDPQGRLQVRRIHCGIDTGVFAPDAAARSAVRQRLGYGETDLVFAVVGPTHGAEGKGQFVFVQAAAQIAQQHPQARFLCIGDGNAIDTLKQRAADAGLGDRFRIHPFSDDPAALIRAVDVLVHPAVSSEALGLVILEALACGLPVIASDLDGIGETFADGVHGLLVPPRDAAALAQAMARLAGDPPLRQRLGAAGRPWIEDHFSLATLGRQTVALYRAAVFQPEH
jgi:glycosyltransferase involved in cell wall biosynthesis